MIHYTKSSPIWMALPLGFAVLSLSACAGSSADYPGFSMPKPSEDGTRVAMRFPTVAVPDINQAREYDAPPVGDMSARMGAINARAAKASAAFDVSLAAARASTLAATGSQIESDEWAEAQIRLADLASHHSDGRMALADLDVIAAEARLAQTPEDDLLELMGLQDSLAASLDEQARVLAKLEADIEL
ncbi:MAG: hypothetical protein AAGB23_04735 [Pseudomonadota bacterium]